MIFERPCLCALAILPLLFVLAIADPAVAQQSTTATYEDWVLRCETQPVPPAKKSCDMEQMTQVKGAPNPLSRAAVTRPAPGQPVKLTVQVPVNVSFATPLRIRISDKEPEFSAPFRRCAPAGCFAELDLKDDVIKKMRTATETGKIMFKDAADRDVAIPLSFKGFGAALDALMKE